MPIETTDDDLTPEQAAAAQKAREQAEARRQKILARGDDRLRHMSGERAGHTPKEEGDEAEQVEGDGEAAGAEAEGNAAAEGGAEGGDSAAAVESAPAPAAPAAKKSSAAAKMAAARRRRFQKNKAAATAAATTAAPAAEPEAASAPAEATSAAAASTEKPPSADVAAAKMEAARSQRFQQKNENEPSSGAATQSTSAGKKYMGVAKMRRKMLKEKQAEAGTKDNDHDNDDDDPQGKKKKPVIVPTKMAASGNMHKHKKKRPYVTLPVLMHALTVTLLFCSGLDLGFNCRPALTTIIETDFAPQQHGLRILGKFGTKTAIKKGLGDEEVEGTNYRYQKDTNTDDEEQFGDEDDDEFGGDKEKKDKLGVGNIDPLFGVDLDMYTSGTGLYFWLARGAVAAHRVNLSIFYYFPLRIYTRTVNMVQLLITTPPMLCLIALVVRQLISKVLLPGGGALPEIGKQDALIEQPKDVLGMATQFGKNMLKSSFPKAIRLYSAWSHLRADMYVILCGLLVGIAYTHSFGGKVVVFDEDISAVIDDEMDNVGMDTGADAGADMGVSDEL